MALTKTILFLVLTAYLLMQVNESLAELDEESLLWDMMKSDSLNGKAVRDIRGCRDLRNSRFCNLFRDSCASERNVDFMKENCKFSCGYC